MALEIIWTRRAQDGYSEIISYLETHFTEKVVREFVSQSHDFFELLSNYPELLERSKNHKYFYRGPINKYTILTYRFNPKKKQIELINIRSSRQKPL